MKKLLKEKKDIINWLEKYQVKNYTLLPDPDYGYTVDVVGDVILSQKNLSEISVKFNHVHGNFLCSNNRLTSLKGSPKTVSNNFLCSYNQLIALDGSPEKVGVTFDCRYNQLLGLWGGPESVGNNFLCNNNEITSLKGAPKMVLGDFDVSQNQLTSIEHLSQVCGDIYLSNNPELGQYQNLTNYDEAKEILAIIEQKHLLRQSVAAPKVSHKLHKV